MLILYMGSAILLFAFLAPPQDCSISGRVSNAATGAPLKRAQVQLSVQTAPKPPQDASFTTDADGAFHFDHLSPGRYSVIANRTGFLPTATPLSDCGTTGIDVKMQPQSRIFGIVLNDEGEPTPGAAISAYRRVWVRGERQFQATQKATSQADGTFTIGDLRPGMYYLSVKSNHTRPGEAAGENFYPDSSDTSAASPINLAPGADERRVQLRVRDARGYTIRGIAENPNGDPVATAALSLVRDSGANQSGVNQGPVASAGTTAGKFEFRNIPPGRYLIQSIVFRFADGSGNGAIATPVPIRVAEADVNDVQVILTPGVDLTGVVSLNDSRVSPNFNLILQPSRGVNYSTQVKDGAFQLNGVAPDVYQVTLQDPLSGYYVKAIKFAGRELSRRQLELVSGAKGILEIVLSDKPGAITGTVRDSNGNALPDTAVHAWTNDDPTIQRTGTDAQGNFSFRDLAPGEYHVIAWKWIEGGVVENSTFRAAFESQTTTAKLDESGNATLDLKVVPKSAVEAQLVRLP